MTFMATTSHDKKRTYVTAVDAKTKKGSRSVTIYGMSPIEVVRLIKNAIENEVSRKAG